MDTNILVKITARAWSLNILALMHNGIAGRQAALMAASGASRTAFGQSLTHLITLGLMERNPGHGHPLRPEYRLTSQGQQIAGTAHAILNIANQTDRQALLRRTWTLPVLAISHQPLYFSDIKRKLPTISDRALSQSLQTLESCNWMSRDIDAGLRPIRPLYSAANEGAKISLATHDLVA